MRTSVSLLVLLIGGSLFTACSKQADTAPGAASTPAETPTTATSQSPTPPASTAEPQAEDSGISFNLSGGSSGAAGSGVTPAIKNANADSEPAQLLNRIYPFYPLSLRMQGIEGRVDVRIRISATGALEAAEVVRATEPRFSEYALAAVRSGQFVPARENGKPVAVESVISIPFVSELGSGSLSPESPLARIAYLDGTYYMKDAAGKMIPAETKEPIRFSIITPFPASAKPGETLKARVKVAITQEGQVTSISVSDATSPEFAAALKEVAPFWQFIPRMKAGKPIASPAIEFPLVLKVPEA